MVVHWVIQENQGDSSGVRGIVDAIRADGHVAHLVFLNRTLEVPPIPELPARVPLVCYGPGFMTRALHNQRFRAGLFFDPKTFLWSAFQNGWTGSMLSSDGQVLSLSEAKRLLLKGDKAFIRPDADSKAFEGAVYDSASLAKATQVAGVADGMPVCVASPIEIDAEWRFFVVNGQIVGCSEYRRWGRPSSQGAVPHLAIHFAQQLAAQWSPAEIYCLDLGTTGSRMGVIEANCFNASRIYAAMPDGIVRAINSHVIERA